RRRACFVWQRRWSCNSDQPRDDGGVGAGRGAGGGSRVRRGRRGCPLEWTSSTEDGGGGGARCEAAGSSTTVISCCAVRVAAVTSFSRPAAGRVRNSKGARHTAHTKPSHGQTAPAAALSTLVVVEESSLSMVTKYQAIGFRIGFGRAGDQVVETVPTWRWFVGESFEWLQIPSLGWPWVGRGCGPVETFRRLLGQLEPQIIRCCARAGYSGEAEARKRTQEFAAHDVAGLRPTSKTRSPPRCWTWWCHGWQMLMISLVLTSPLDP
ncbi:unnamed protein product, partial [Pylaiella littoralis]